MCPDRPPPLPRLPGRVMRMFWLAIGVASLALGAVGVVLPLLPTTPLVLLAAFAFTRGSPRLRQMLVEHRLFGPIIEDWEERGCIAARYKVIACTAMGVVLLASLIAGLPGYVIAIQVVCMGAAAVFVLTRPTCRDW